MVFYNELMAIQNYITYTKIGGVIPLDIIVHFIIGAVIAIALLKFKIRYTYTVLCIVLISIFKEVIDFFRIIDFSYLESIKDILITNLYIILIGIIRRIKNR